MLELRRVLASGDALTSLAATADAPAEVQVAHHRFAPAHRTAWLVDPNELNAGGRPTPPENPASLALRASSDVASSADEEGGVPSEIGALPDEGEWIAPTVEDLGDTRSGDAIDFPNAGKRPDAGESAPPEESDPRVPLLVTGDFVEVRLGKTDQPQPVRVDVLTNDLGDGLRIVALEQGLYGNAEIAEGTGSEQSFVRYTPGDVFAEFDRFDYIVEDAAGTRGWATAWIRYVREIDPPFAVAAPARVVATSPGAAVEFRDATGAGLISIDYEGEQSTAVGVLVGFQPNEAPFGQPIPGRLSNANAAEASFFPQVGGEAWIYGSISQVNSVLVGLRFEPMPGFSSPDGLGLAVHAILYAGDGAKEYASATISVVVPSAAETPTANGDFYVLESARETVRLKVLDNDVSPTGSALRLVGVSQLPGTSETVLDTRFGSTIAIDPVSNEIVFTTGSIVNYESFVYVLADEQGSVAITWPLSGPEEQASEEPSVAEEEDQALPEPLAVA